MRPASRMNPFILLEAGEQDGGSVLDRSHYVEKSTLDSVCDGI